MSPDNLLDEIPTMNLGALRQTWSAHLGDPPPIRSRDILRRALAEALQMKAVGTDPVLERRLAKAAGQHRMGRKPKVRTVAFKPGSHLVRHWQGERHQVEVVQGGFVWNGARYGSLSQIARKITGVRWNGPRFFGLREDLVA